MWYIGGFSLIFQDDEKAEDEMAKRRAAFLLKQQRKAEEARLRKLQQEAESELKRDEARWVWTWNHMLRNDKEWSKAWVGIWPLY